MRTDNKSYSWNPGDYASHSSAQYKWAMELINEISLKGGESIIDIGCGDGKITALISSIIKNGNVIGIDNSMEMVNFAQNNFPSLKYPNLSYIHQDATKLNFNNQFDIAFSNSALHWVSDHIAVLKGVKKGLKKNGRIYFRMGGKDTARDVIEIVDNLIQDSKWRTYFDNFYFPCTFYSADEYKQLLADVGLTPVRVELTHKDMTQEGREGFAGFLRNTLLLAYNERIPEKKRGDFADDIINQYSQISPMDNNGLFRVKMVRLLVEAIKV